MLLGFPRWLSGKEPTWQCRRLERLWFYPWVGKVPLEKGIATDSSILAGIILWTEDPGGLQSMQPQRVGHDWAQHSTQQLLSLCVSGCHLPSVQMCTGCCCWHMWCGHTQLCVVSRALTVHARLSSPLKKPYWEWLSMNIRLLEGLSWICSKVVKEQKINQW